MANTSPTNISLQGWDTANVTSFDVINSAIVKQAKTPPPFSFTSGDPLSVPSATGVWDTWSLVPGGSGQTLQMNCPIKSGVAILAAPTASGLTLDKTTAGAGLTIDAATGLTVSFPKASVTAPPQSVLGSVGRHSGKYYFEVTLGAAANTAIVGIAPAGPAGQAFASTTPGAYGYRSDGQAMSAGAAVAFPGGAALSWKQGDTVGVAVDIDAGKIWFRGPDGKWQGAAGADPVTGTNPAFSFTPGTSIYAAVAIGDDVSATANFLEMAASFTPPAGYTAFLAVFSTAKLDGSSVSVQIALAKTALTPSKTALMADPTSTAASPAVVVMSFTPPSGSTLTRAQINQITAGFDYELNQDIANFKNIFHTFDVNSALAANKNLAWLNPTANEYAVADAASAATATSAFALLSMTENRDDSMLSAQVDPSILGGLPTGANSVFAMSAERFTTKVLLNVATTTLVGSTTADFDFDTTGLVITNNKDLPWREITLQDNVTKVTPTVPAGGLKIFISGRHVELEFSGVHFDVPGWPFPGHKIATLGFTQKIFLVLAKRTDGSHVLVAKNVDPDTGTAQQIADDLPTVERPFLDVSFDQTAIDYQNAMQAISIALSVLSGLLVIFSAGAWIIRARQVAAAAQAAAANGAGMLNIAGNIYEGTDAALNAAQQDAGCVACMTGGGVSAGGSLFVLKLAYAGSILAIISGISTGVMWVRYGQTMGKDLAAGNVDNLAAAFTVETFLTDGLAPYDWTGTSNSWTPVDARLADSLLIYGNLT
jgi:Clostridium P-47 protein/SPRY domain